MKTSVIIPVLNEAGCLAETIRQTRLLGPHEVIVVDGGSTDATWQLAERADQRLSTAASRGVQQNAGARAASGDVLLFLHADCRLGADAFEAIAGALNKSRVVAGCFQQSIDSPRRVYRLIERGNALRVRTTGLAYGDQGIFVRRDAFFECGGFPSVRVMEDVFLMKRLRRLGRIAIVPSRIHVSARRWESKGVVRQTLRNWMLVSLAHFAVHPDRLVRFYPEVR